MPFLDASALETDPEGAAFLLAVLRWRPDPRRSQAWGRLSPLLGPHTIRFARGLAAAGLMRRSRRERVGFHLMRQGTLRLSQPPPYRITVRAGVRG